MDSRIYEQEQGSLIPDQVIRIGIPAYVDLAIILAAQGRPAALALSEDVLLWQDNQVLLIQMDTETETE